MPKGLASGRVMENSLNGIVKLIKSTECKVTLRYFCFCTVFALCFAVMFAILLVAVIGVTFGVIMTTFGTAVLLFHADFIISGIAPEIMLFGGLTAVFVSGFLGMLAVKLGYIVSRFFLRTRRSCEKLREREEFSEENTEILEKTKNESELEEE